jgi:hypothetical protein
MQTTKKATLLTFFGRPNTTEAITQKRDEQALGKVTVLD